MDIGKYSRWNLALLREFFTPSRRNEEVWLSLDKARIASIGPKLGGYDGLLVAVRNGPEWKTVIRQGRYHHGQAQDLVQRARGLVEQRTKYYRRPSGYTSPEALNPMYHGMNAPTYLPILAVLIAQVSIENDDDLHGGYYQALRKALHLPENWGSAQMAQLEVLWKDLHQWCQACNGRLGLFIFRQLGGYARIGIPRSQCVLNAKDAQSLTRVFAHLRLEPGLVPDDRSMDRILAKIESSIEFSAPLRAAAADPQYRAVLESRIAGILRDWDGSVSVTEGEAAEKLGVALFWDRENSCWKVGWALADLAERQGEVMLERGSCGWRGVIKGAGRAYARLQAKDEASDEIAALRLSENEPQHFGATVIVEGEFSKLGNYRLSRSPLRVLVPDRQEPRPTIVEAPLPRSGPCYLLAAPGNVGNTLDFFERNDIEFEEVAGRGLPDGWALALVRHFENVGDQVRREIPDGMSERDASPVIKRVGGSYHGSPREYFRYDLPEIEFDAPPGAAIDTDPPELLEPIEAEGTGELPGGGARRFRLREEDIGNDLYRVVVQAQLEGREFGKPIRILIRREDVLEVPAVEFSLDEVGRGKRGIPGIRGTLWTAAPTSSHDHGGFSERDESESSAVANTYSAALAGRFLDRLTLSSGRIGAGRARQLISSLARAAVQECSDNELLVRLWRRGLLEIDVDDRGRFRRVYAVRPCFYPLGEERGGWRTFGLCGTLTTGIVANIANKLKPYLKVAEDDALPGLPSICFRLPPGAEISEVAGKVGVDVSDFTPVALVDWSAGIDEAEHWFRQFAGSRPEGDFEEYKVVSGEFEGILGGAVPGLNDRPAALFRVKDRQSGGVIHTLALEDPASSLPAFAYAPDRQWAIWIVWSKWGQFLSREFGVTDAERWPIPYDSKGNLYLPSCMRPPVLLERSLVLCSGVNPRTINFEIEDFEESRLLLQNPSSPYDSIVARSVYRPGGDESRLLNSWRVYENVPRDVAEAVAGKLNASLDNADPSVWN